jgi:aspartate aminotransferase-like enzyme
MRPELTDDQRRALEESHGCVLGTSYVLMSKDVFRQTMGIADDEDLAASLEAIQDAIKDLGAGRTIPLEEAKARLDAKYGVQS